MIIDIESELRLASSTEYFFQQSRRLDATGNVDAGDAGEGQDVDDELAGSVGQNFRKRLMETLL
jgi:hypothetical protein